MTASSQDTETSHLEELGLNTNPQGIMGEHEDTTVDEDKVIIIVLPPILLFNLNDVLALHLICNLNDILHFPMLINYTSSYFTLKAIKNNLDSNSLQSLM